MNGNGSITRCARHLPRQRPKPRTSPNRGNVNRERPRRSSRGHPDAIRAQQADGPHPIYGHQTRSGRAPHVARHGLSLSPPRTWATWQARLGIRFAQGRDLRAWLFLASTSELPQQPPAKISPGLLEAKTHAKLGAGRGKPKGATAGRLAYAGSLGMRNQRTGAP